ncbi:MAG: ISKra4 family transposase [Janthinobacterium lividum]
MQWTVRLEARTSAGEVTTTELVTFSRPRVVSTLTEVGLVLDESKALLARLQASMLCGQVAAYAAHHRVCTACGVRQPLKDRRTRRLQTRFGTVEVEALRFKLCRCRQPAPMAGVTVSSVCTLLTARCTPELERVQAELGACTSFRDAARILDALLPVSPANQESVRTRTHAVALQLEAADRQAAADVTAVPHKPNKGAAADASRPVVMLDGAYIRAVPDHQIRNFEAICGKVEHEGHPTRRFGLVRSVARQPHALLRAALLDQGWREGEAVTAISDGDPALPALVRSATGGPVEPILDWFHLSMRVHHVEQVMGGLCALEPPPSVPPDQAQIDVERLRHLLWNGHHKKACEALGRIVSWAKDASVLNDPAMEQGRSAWSRVARSCRPTSKTTRAH